ncbi:NUDIX domain-containing protein [Roseibium sp. AS2]|uniref:NUDIX domain-containing protein n=1 Tax=Roseibium sp. AS2 TaxID=3135781 RepID=UPI003171DC17
MELSAIPIRDPAAHGAFRPFIRSTPRAFILRADRLLVQEKRHPEKGLYYTLPGGKQDPGESLHECLKRECREEIGADVTIEDLLHVAEVYRVKSGGIERQHQLDFVFGCSVPDDYTPVLGNHPDPHQVATHWITAESSQQLRPAYVTKLFPLGCTRMPEVYLGPHDD